MQHVQIMCAKLVLNRSKPDSSNPAFYELYLHQMRARIKFIYICKSVCNIGRGSVYLAELLTKSVSGRPGLKEASNSCIIYHLPCARKQDRSLFYNRAKNNGQHFASVNQTVRFSRCV